MNVLKEKLNISVKICLFLSRPSLFLEVCTHSFIFMLNKGMSAALWQYGVQCTVPHPLWVFDCIFYLFLHLFFSFFKAIYPKEAIREVLKIQSWLYQMKINWIIKRQGHMKCLIFCFNTNLLSKKGSNEMKTNLLKMLIKWKFSKFFSFFLFLQ